MSSDEIDLLEGAKEFFLAERHNNPILLVRGISGLPEIAAPRHTLFRVSYLPPEAAVTDHGISQAKSELHGRFPLLLQTVPCPDGPPHRSGIIFRRHQTVSIPWTDGRHARPEIEAEQYLAAVTLQNYSWGSDLMRGAPGYFLSGPSEAGTLWKIARVEFDVGGRQVFTLSPIRLASGLPNVDFSSVAGDALRQKLAEDWSDVQKSLAGNSPYALVTAAKNVAESLAFVALEQAPGRLSFDKALAEIGNRIKAKQPLALPFEFLDYHLMSKLRILHGKCHSDQVVISGRLLEPEFAFSAAMDLIQVLRSARLARG